MGLETATYISELDNLWPLVGDPVNQGDDHLRLLKDILQNQFPNFTATAMNLTVAELNLLDGLTAAAAEINILDGALVNTGELNLLQGLTADAAELNLLDGKSLASVDDVIDNFPSGTLMTFQQTTAPTGWTKETTHNNKALRVVSGAAGSGGTSPFSTVFGLTATDSYTLLEADVPAHDHGSAGAHSHTPRRYTGGTGNGNSPQPNVNDDITPINMGLSTTTDGAHTHNSYGGSGGHSHNMEMRVQYVDLIIASKD